MNLYKKHKFFYGTQQRCAIKRILRISCLLICLNISTVFASTSYLQARNISLVYQNTSLKEILKEIETQSEYSFFYSEEIDMNTRVSINVKDESIENILQALLADTGLSYKITDNFISLHNTAKQNTSQGEKNILITGTVFDERDSEMTGVSVAVRGTTIGTVTDVNGEFSLTVPSDTSVLQFRFIGYKMREVAIQKRRVVAINLEEILNEIDEVTVVAFARQKKESVIASIATVRPSELKVPSSNLTTALAGRIAGVISYQRSGEPGQDNAEFFIRGITTFGTNKNPLILIDGVELSSDDLSRLNTDDIASFSVMKDANATALYGARGANGVILITTKEGTSGAAKVSVRFENSISAPASTVKLADPITYMRLGNEAVRTRNPLGVIPYSDEKIANTGTGNPYVYPATDWAKLLFKDQTMNQRVNMNISGGGKVARYYIAASFSQDNGILNVDKRNNFNSNIDLKKYLLRSNLNIDVTSSTELIVRLHGTFDDYSGPLEGGADLYRKVMRTNPVLFPAYYAPDRRNMNTQHILFGNYDGAGYVNPYADMVKGYKDSSKTLVLAQLELKQDLSSLLKGLSLRGLFNTTRYSSFDVSRSYKPFYYKVGAYDKYTDIYNLTTLNETDGTEWLDYKEGGKDVYSTMYFETALQYNSTFADDHAVSGLFVFTGRDELRGNAGDLQKSLPYRNVGLAGRVTYGYQSKYFIEGNFGYNGSERFAAKERFGFFPSIGVGYMVSNEDFWEPLKDTFTKVKLKGTYGLVGNDNIGDGGDRFFYLSNVNLDDGGRGMSFGTDFRYHRNGVSISRYADPHITWETAYKQNYGIEIGLWGKFDIQADYFREDRKDILQKRADIPVTMGLQAEPQSNIGESYASGFDVSVDYSHMYNNGAWLSMRGNFTYATGKYKVYEEPAYANAPWRLRKDQKLSQQWGFIAERLFLDDEDVKNSPKQDFGEYGAGDIKYKDINMDGVINDNDMVPIGYPESPEIIYGFGASVGYKGFDLSAFFQGSAQSSFWIDPNSIAPFVNTNALMQIIADDYWSEDNRNPHAFWPRLSNYSLDNNTKRSTWFMRDGTFIRLKNAELGYTMPKRISNTLRMEQVRIYLSGSNLLTFSNFKLWDPEMAGNGLGYPVQRVFNIGININL